MDNEIPEGPQAEASKNAHKRQLPIKVEQINAVTKKPSPIMKNTHTVKEGDEDEEWSEDELAYDSNEEFTVFADGSVQSKKRVRKGEEAKREGKDRRYASIDDDDDFEGVSESEDEARDAAQYKAVAKDVRSFEKLANEHSRLWESMVKRLHRDALKDKGKSDRQLTTDAYFERPDPGARYGMMVINDDMEKEPSDYEAIIWQHKETGEVRALTENAGGKDDDPEWVPIVFRRDFNGHTEYEYAKRPVRKNKPVAPDQSLCISLKRKSGSMN